MKKEFTILSYSGYYSEIRNKLSEMHFNFVENEGQTIVNFDSEELASFLSELGYPVHFEENGYIIRVGKRWIVENINPIIDDLKEIFKEKL